MRTQRSSLALVCLVLARCGQGGLEAPDASASIFSISGAASIGYLGCFADTAQRSLPVLLIEAGATAQGCLAAAKAQDLAYAGLQWYGECWGGDSLPNAKVADTECNTRCNADPDRVCGGGWRNSIYDSRAELTPATEYLGCYGDSADRALPTLLAAQGATSESCIAAAAAQRLPYAGIQWYGECWGGTTVGRARVSDSRCDTPCAANPNQMCGGAWFNAIFKVAANPAAPPTFSPPGGFYIRPLSVTLSCDEPGCTIRYTADGSTPTEASPLYSAPVTLSATTTLKAIALAPGFAKSDVGTAVYVVSTVPAITSQAQWDEAFEAHWGFDPSSLPDTTGGAETFAWHGHYWVRAYVSMAKTFGDTKYLDAAATTIESWLSLTEGQGGWGLSLGTAQQLIDTGMIAHGAMYFVYVVWSDPRFAAYRGQADEFLNRLEPIVRYYDYQWVDDPPSDIPAGSPCGCPGFYRYATCGDGTMLCSERALIAYNQGATLVKAMLLMHLVQTLKGVTPDPDFLAKSEDVAAYFTKFATVNEGGAYIWDYAGCRDQRVEDVTHGAIDLSFLVWAGKRGLGGLTSTDMKRLAATLKNNLLNGEAGTTDVSWRVDGTGTISNDWDRVSVGYDWIDLAEYDETLLVDIIAVFNTRMTDLKGSRFFLAWAEILRWTNGVKL